MLWPMALRQRVCVAACVVLGLGLALRGVSHRLLFPVAEVRSARGLPGFVEHRVRARDGVMVRALELPGPGDAPVLVHFHNNREVAEQAEQLALELGARGVGVMLVEYRGYGDAEGEAPSEAGLYADAEAALDVLTLRGVEAKRIVLWGTSLGTGVAAEMARRGRGGRLVLVTPYTSIPDLVTSVVPFVPAHLLIADHFDSLSKAPGIGIPTVVIHGDADEIVPFAMGERLAGAIPGASLLRIAGGRHGNLLQLARHAIVDVLLDTRQR